MADMNITAIKAHPASIPFEVPRVTAHEPMRAASVILVEVRTDEGITGIGQIHGAPIKDICEWVERLGEVARGMDALAHTAIWEKLFSLTAPRPHGFRGKDGLPPPLPRGARPQITAAMAGIDLALWDIKGKAAGLPVYRLLGGEKRPVLTYGTGGYYHEDDRPDGCAEEIAGFVARGYKAVKIKVGGQTIAEDTQRVRLAREAIGEGTLLLLDCTGAYGLDEAIAFARAVEPYRAYWLEEPLYWYLQPADFSRLAAAVDIPLAHCERDLHRFTVRDYIVSGGVRYVQFDSTRHGGFTESLRIAELAGQLGARISPHQVPELHAHLCAAYPGISFGVESNGTPDPLWSGMYAQRAEIRDGHVHLSDAPGFGIEIDWKFIDRHRV
ncbi:MAG: mandelate racemase/muconate lactonizing enzyme family protein [Burkholderiales bacterium]|nr:mandelate racemase/muconate lactonizing enzyme family protein [Burkholderiales bacterium]